MRKTDPAVVTRVFYKRGYTHTLCCRHEIQPEKKLAPKYGKYKPTKKMGVEQKKWLNRGKNA